MGASTDAEEGKIDQPPLSSRSPDPELHDLTLHIRHHMLWSSLRLFVATRCCTIDQHQVVPWPHAQHGLFYVPDERTLPNNHNVKETPKQQIDHLPGGTHNKSIKTR